MKPEEATEILEEIKELDDTLYAYSDIYMKALETAISALKEIQQYRLIKDVTIGEIAEVLKEFSKIGTVEECREAVEKQKPKKIIIRNWNPTRCPTCGHELSTSLGDGYYKHPTFLERCPNCGQAIQWDENLEGVRFK